MSAQTAPSPTDYADLTPDTLLDAVEQCGYRSDGRFIALNSYENRVYQVGVEDGTPVIAKFYRPCRWSDEAIAEEHSFAVELAEQEIPVVAPMLINRSTLHTYRGYRFALYRRHGGHWPELNTQNDREWVGRFIARIHAVGATQTFSHRPILDIDSFGHQSVRYLLENDFIPAYIETAYRTLAEDLLQQISAAYKNAGNIQQLRLHGDCHPGNILWGC
jgi:Ser/Thr protein kinase RdoA (MazF antagonist)